MVRVSLPAGFCLLLLVAVFSTSNSYLLAQGLPTSDPNTSRPVPGIVPSGPDTTGTSAGTISQPVVDQYTNKTLLDQARKQCQSVISTGGISSVFNDDGAGAIAKRIYKTGGSGGGTVAVQDVGVISQLSAVNSFLGDLYSLLSERNFSDDCFKVLAMANAQKAITKHVRNSLDVIKDKNLNNADKMVEENAKKRIEQARDAINKSDSKYKDSQLQGLSIALEDPEYIDATYEPAKVERVVTGGERADWNDYYTIMILKNNPEAQAMDAIRTVRTVLNAESGQIYQEAAQSGGVVGDRVCTKTESGANPEDVKFTDRDCVEWEAQPVIITQERLKQIVNAPYNQAFSPSAELGMDGALSNINTRINNGTLFSQNVGDNFGTGSGNNSSITDAEKIKNSLINPATSTPPGTVSLGILIHDAVNTLYTSSTSSCIYLPVTERQRVSVEAITKKAELVAYKTDLEKKWVEVLKSPKLDYTTFFIRLTMDFTNKYSKDWVKTVLDDAKEKATRCATAKANATVSTTTTPTVTLP